MLKYSYYSAPSLKYLVRLDWEIHSNVERIFNAAQDTEQSDTGNGGEALQENRMLRR